MFIGSTHINIQLNVPFKDFSLIDIWRNRQTYLALETPFIMIFQPPIIILELAQVQNQCPRNNTHLIKLYCRGSFQKTWLSLIIRSFRKYVKTDRESNLVWVNIRFKFLSWSSKFLIVCWGSSQLILPFYTSTTKEIWRN